MKKTTFKVLMYCGQYVDVNLLEKGVYACEKPCLYSEDETIESIEARGRKLIDMQLTCFISENYFDNLKQCDLVIVSLKEVEGEQECDHPFASVMSKCDGEINHCLKCGEKF